MADVCIINKIDTASGQEVLRVRSNIMAINPDAEIIEAASPISISDHDAVRGKSVLVIEDGPTVTHGEMPFGAGFIAAKKYGAKEIVDPRKYISGSLKETFAKYTHLDAVLPAMGYGASQVSDLENTVNTCDCDIVIMGTPIDLTRVMSINKPYVRTTYELQEIGHPTLKEVLKRFAAMHCK